MSRILLPYLVQVSEVYWFVDDEGWDYARNTHDDLLALFQGRVFHYLRAFDIDREHHFDVCVYHVEDCPECRFSEFAIPLMPSWGIIHDLTFLDEPERNNRISHLSVLSALGDWAMRGLVDAFPFQQCSRMTLPVLTSMSAGPTDKTLFSRTREGLLVGFYGFEPQEHLCWTMVEAFCRLSANALSEGSQSPRLRWFMPSPESVEEWRNKLASVGETFQRYVNCIEFIIVSSAADLERQLLDTDIGVNLIANRRQGPSLFSYLCLSLGIPLIVGDYAATEEWPNECVLKTRFGLGEDRSLDCALLELMSNRNLRNQLALNGKRYIEDVHSPQGVLHDILTSLANHQGQLTNVITRHREKVQSVQTKLSERGNQAMDGLVWSQKNNIPCALRQES
jgi:hypothetical protein